jgi:flagellar motor switch protein FliM
MQDLRKAWQIIDDFDFALDRFEPDIDFAQITSQSESVLLITFELFIGEQSYLMNICFATFAFDTILSKLSSQNLSTIRPLKYSGTTAKNLLVNHLNLTELMVEVEFGKAAITFDQLLNLDKGDIIIMNKRVGEEVKVKIGNKVLFYGTSGFVNNHKAVKISRKAEKGDK